MNISRLEHDSRVQSIAAQVRLFHDRGEQYRIYHGSTNTTRKVQLRRNAVVDTSGMIHVLAIDTISRTAYVEPNVSMEHLVDATLVHGLVPRVVMEFPAITVGGGFAGTAGESSSFRHGLFDHTVVRIEIVLADGTITEASANANADLFGAAAGSFGSFGVITLLEVSLMPAKPYVELTYIFVEGIEESLRVIETLSAKKETDYLDGILFAANKGVVMSGKLADKLNPDHKCTRYTRAKDPWFYLRAREIVENDSGGFKEFVPLKDYLFRYDRGAFWAGWYAFRYFITPFNAWTRWALDALMRAKVMYQALHKSRISDQYIVQDIAFPYATVGEFTDYIDRTLCFYPLWLCPIKMEKETSLRPYMVALEETARCPGMMMNVGLWGPGPSHYDDFVACNRAIEKKTADLHGLKCFYAQGFYTRDEFWRIYDGKWYDALRAKYRATGLPSVFDRVNVDLSKRIHTCDQCWKSWAYERFKEQWPMRGMYGVLNVLLSREYLLRD